MMAVINKVSGTATGFGSVAENVSATHNKASYSPSAESRSVSRSFELHFVNSDGDDVYATFVVTKAQTGQTVDSAMGTEFLLPQSSAYDPGFEFQVTVETV